MTAEQPPASGSDGTRARVVTALNKLALAMRTDAQQRSREHGLHPTQAQLLSLLATRPADGLRLGGLASELGVTAATASDSVAALERKGLVRRTRSAIDARVVHVSLTDDGRRAAASLTEWPDVMLQALDDLDADECAALLRVLLKMIRSLQERGVISPARMCVTCTYFDPYAHPGADRPHHCNFVDAPFGDAELRVDCVDHVPASSTS